MTDRLATSKVHAALAAGALLILAACGSTTPSATPKTYTGTLTFASFNPFTGPDASFGPEMAAGCIPAAKTINDAGGVLGHQVQCIAVDTRGDPADAVTAAQQMIATAPNLVGMNGPSSDEALATVPIINRANVPMFADSGQAAFDKSTYKYFYRLTSPGRRRRRHGDLCLQQGLPTGRGDLRQRPQLAGERAQPSTAFAKLGGQIVVNQTLTLDQSSYRTEVTAAVAANPDVIFTEADPQTDAAYLSQLQQLHGMIPGRRHPADSSTTLDQSCQRRHRQEHPGAELRGRPAVFDFARTRVGGLQHRAFSLGIFGASARPVEPGPILRDRLRRDHHDGAGHARGENA